MATDHSNPSRVDSSKPGNHTYPKTPQRPTTPSQSHYALLKIAPWANVQDIRKAYRDLSKLYHPDTTTLPEDVATAKFQALNEAYAVLSNPDQRSQYDLKHGYSRFSVVQPTRNLNQPVQSSSKVPGWSDTSRIRSNSAYLDPNDRPLSSGELFAVVLLGITFIGCLGLVFLASIFRGEVAFPPIGLIG